MNTALAGWLAQNPDIIAQVEGKNIFLSEAVYPQDLGEEAITTFARRFLALPDFYAHYGGAGDALLLMASFYDRQPRSVILSLANSARAISAFFEAFPLLENVILLPPPPDIIHSVILRRITGTLNNCLGMGTSPAGDYNEEWNAPLDIVARYGIVKRPAWAERFRKGRIAPQQVAIAPKGSGMALLRNIIPPEDWRYILGFLAGLKISPVIIGTPDEAAEYPAGLNCIDRRSWSFAGQMEIIASSDLLIAADSWHKTFAALAGVPAIVYEPETDPSLHGTEIISDHVFYRPWESIVRVKDFGGAAAAFAGIMPGPVWKNLFL